jgi:hypothetical protein
MSAIRNFIHLGSSGSVIYLEPVNHSFSASEAEKRRILYSTQFLGKKIIQEQSFYHFGAPSSSQNILDSLQVSFPDPNGFDSIADIKLHNDARLLALEAKYIEKQTELTSQLTELTAPILKAINEFKVMKQVHEEMFRNKTKFTGTSVELNSLKPGHALYIEELDTWFFGTKTGYKQL